MMCCALGYVPKTQACLHAHACCVCACTVPCCVMPVPITIYQVCRYPTMVITHAGKERACLVLFLSIAVFRVSCLDECWESKSKWEDLEEIRKV